jgi:hypothetical protein
MMGTKERADHFKTLISLKSGKRVYTGPAAPDFKKMYLKAR